MRVLIILVNTQKLFLLINNRKINCKTMTTLQNNYDKLKNLISNQISTFLWDCILNHRNHHHYPSRHFCFPTVPNILNDVFQCQQIHSSSDSLHFHWHVQCCLFLRTIFSEFRKCSLCRQYSVNTIAIGFFITSFSLISVAAAVSASSCVLNVTM